MRRAVRRKWVAMGLVGVGLVAGSMYLFAKDYGPYSCVNCLLGAPQPDKTTYAMLSKLAPSIGFRWTESGNTYVICSPLACGYYRVTSSGDFHGDKVVKQTFLPPGGGGGGGLGSAIGGGGGDQGGGCRPSCGPDPGGMGSGTVNVGGVTKAKPK